MTSNTTFYNYFLTVDAYSKNPKLFSIDKITTEEVMDKLDMFQYKFGIIDKFGWCDLENISADAGIKFASTQFKEEFQTCRFHLMLADSEHQEMNGRVKVT